jgi:hypothetical protein
MADTQFGLTPALKLAGQKGKWLTRLGAFYPDDINPELSMKAAYELELEMSRKAVAKINALSPRPAFAVVCGDLTNAFPKPLDEAGFGERVGAWRPAERSSLLGELAAQVQDFKDIFRELREDVPLVCVCGNHDVGNIPNRRTIGLWGARFGDDYFSFDVADVRFLVLNTQLYLYEERPECADLAAAQDAWVDTELADASSAGRRIIVFSHVPPFLSDPEEETEGWYYSNRKVVPLMLFKPVRMRLLRKFAAAGVTHWFCGHYHRNSGGTFRDEHGNTIEVVVTTAVGAQFFSDPKHQLGGIKDSFGAKYGLDDGLSGFRHVKCDPAAGVVHEFVALDAADAFVPLDAADAFVPLDAATRLFSAERHRAPRRRRRSTAEQLA